MLKIARYGWVRDIPDQRDLLLLTPEITLPAHIDLRPLMPPVFDQGNEGSCTANAAATAAQFAREKAKEQPDFVPSRQFIYWWSRYLEGTTSYDSGAQIRDTFKAMSKYGICPEYRDPYTEVDLLQKPSADAVTSGKQHLLTQYLKVAQNITAMKTCLAQGWPFEIGFTVYESFEGDAVAATGIVPMPKSDENVMGGHAVLVVGFDDPSLRFIVRNSWGADWGIKGYFTIPYAYFINSQLASDLWTARQVKQ